jgi:flagellar biosynthetic protein FliR
MAWSADLCLAHAAIFALVLARVAPLILIAPLFGSLSVPLRVRLVLALALAVLVVPAEWEKSVPRPETVSAFLVQSGAELLIGITLGAGMLLLFASMHVAGQTISQMSGLRLGDAYDPGFVSQSPGFSQLLSYVTVAVFVLIGGHRRVLEALLDSFVWMPAGQGAVSRSIFAAMTTLLTHSFALGLRAAGPAIVALLLSTLILGLVSRTLPQLNLLVLGFGVNALTTTAVLGVSLGAAAWVFQDQFEAFLETTLVALGGG